MTRANKMGMLDWMPMPLTWNYIENIRYPSERAHSYQITMTCTALRNLGVNPTLIVPDRKLAPPAQEDLLTSRLTPDFPILRLPVIDALAHAPLWLSRPAYLLERFTFQRAVHRFAIRHHADIWYTRDPWMVPAFAQLGRRVVLELHDASGSKLKRLARIRRQIWKYVVITSGLKDVLISAGVLPDDILVAPDAYDPNDFTNMDDRTAVRKNWGVPDNAIVTLYAGSFYPWKGVDLVVDAWPKTDPTAHLVMIGGPINELTRIRETVRKRSISRVHCFNMLPHTEVVRQFSGADIGLLPTSPLHVVGRSYTSPLKLFEYLAAGLPILASDVPSSREILTEDIAQFFSSSESQFLSALQRMENTGWRQRASARAKVIVQPFTWRNRTKSIVQWLQSALTTL